MARKKEKIDTINNSNSTTLVSSSSSWSTNGSGAAKNGSQNGKGDTKISSNSKPKKKSSTDGKTNGAAGKSSSASKKGTTILLSIIVASISFGVGVLSPSILAAYMIHLASPLSIDELASHPLLSHIFGRRLKAVMHGAGGCMQQNLDLFLHADDNPIPGLHVVCIHGSKNNDKTLDLTLYRESTKKGAATKIQVPKKWSDIRGMLVEELDLIFYNDFTEKESEKWAVFSPNGQKIADHLPSKNNNKIYLDNVVQSQMVVIFEGGVWLWPGVREGFERHVTLSSVFPTEKIKMLSLESLGGHNNRATPSGSSSSMVRRLLQTREEDVLTLKTLSLVPLVLSVDHFLTEDECEHIIDTATPHMEYSGVSLKDSDQGKAASNWRTSKQAFLPAHNDEKLMQVGTRVASLTRIPVSHQEQVQVLRYGKTEKYDAHNDFFDPFHYKKSPDVLETIEHGEKNRLATVFWYLTDVEQGGETIFPRQGGKPAPRSYASCNVGMKVTPRRGRVIIFYSMTPAGDTDEYSLHGACPVVEGIKWAANKWVWNRPSGYSA